MDIFDIAFIFLIKHEGGLSNDPDDPGGITKYGISFRFLKAIQPDATEETIKNLSLEEAKAIYKKYWWEDNKYDQIEDKDIAIKIFDIAVNIGNINANRKLQKACNRTMPYPNSNLQCDGIIGPLTLSYINKNQSKSELILAIFEDLVETYYRQIVENNPKLDKFLNTWLNRLYDKSY